ncbi:MAG: alpha/beta hydrolase [Acidobacteria bacterium]|nr:MAG: alpha/beta hydrolase [Acidobacteriota bacterium]
MLYTQRLIRAAHHANSFGPEIIYHPEGGVWRFWVKPANGRLALAIFFFGRAAFSTASAQTPAVHKPQRQPGSATLEGQWSGSLPAGEAILHLVLHISKVEDGSFKATIDSLDQGVYGIEVTALTRKDSTLHFNVSSVGASYEGKFTADRNGIEGDWTQGSYSLPLVFHRQAAGARARKPSDAVASAEGVWQGALEGNGMRLRLQLHVSHDDQKQLVAALDSPDQGVSGLPAIQVSQKGAGFHFEIPVVGGVYDGTLNAAKATITGSWTQNSVEQKLDFQRSDQLLELVRPQNPAKPYPYQEEEVIFTNGKAKISLAGTLTVPRGPRPFPAAILLSDSGPHDRDESLVGHRPFLVLADHLTRKGIAVLRFDKRGIGKSTGDYANATTEDFASDAEAALAYLKAHQEIDQKKIGLIGHSEGGMIAPLVATHSGDVAWIVLLAGPGLKGEDNLLLQSERILKTAGVNDEQIASTREFNKQTYALVRQERDPSTLQAKLSDLVQSSGMSASLPPAAFESQVRMMVSPWFRFFLDYDPLPALQRTMCPVLALHGEKDLQAPPKENLAKIRKALEDAGNKDFQTTELPGLNHLFQHGPTGSPTEYGGIQETMAPEALNAVSDWVLRHTEL